MGPDWKGSPFHRRLQAALDGLRGLALADLEPAALLVALTVLGDAIRLGMEVPSPILRVAEALSDDAFRSAFRALHEETATWTLPIEPDNTGDLADYAWAVRRRDEAESVLVAARRVLVPRGTLPDELEEIRAFDAVLTLCDFTCGGKLGRGEAERALGERMIFARPGSWLDALPDLEETESSAEDRDESAIEAPPHVLPSDAAVDAYVTRGRLAASIEGAARRSLAFAEELEAMIDATVAAGATHWSLRARRWRNDRAGQPRSGASSRGRAGRPPIRIDAVPRLALAAADRDEAPEALKRTVRLGVLAPLDVEARLTVSAETTTLRLYPARGLDLAHVQLGSSVSHAADAEGIWRVDIPTSNQAIELRVEARDGQVFEEIIELCPEG